MYCVYCGHEMKENDIFCGDCGLRKPTQKVKKEETVIIYKRETPVSPLMNNSLIVLMTFAVLLFSVFMIFGISFLTSDYEPDNVYDCGTAEGHCYTVVE